MGFVAKDHREPCDIILSMALSYSTVTPLPVSVKYLGAVPLPSERNDIRGHGVRKFFLGFAEGQLVLLNPNFVDALDTDALACCLGRKDANDAGTR